MVVGCGFTQFWLHFWEIASLIYEGILCIFGYRLVPFCIQIRSEINSKLSIFLHKMLTEFKFNRDYNGFET